METATKTAWSHEYETLRREDLFRNPPSDHTAYPLLHEAVRPHIESFNAIFGSGRGPSLMKHAIADIGTKCFRDGELSGVPGRRNDLRIRVVSIGLRQSEVPASRTNINHSVKLYPWECRERGVTYKGRLTATLEYSINGGDPIQFEKELSQAPILVKVSLGVRRPLSFPASTG
jgi:DNA-directed RNA polymerase I subunit RPA2